MSNEWIIILTILGIMSPIITAIIIKDKTKLILEKFILFMKWIKELCRNTIRFFRKRRMRAEYIDLALSMNKVVKLAHECVKYSYELTRYKYDEQGRKRTIEEYGQKVFEFEDATREFNNKIYDINEDEWQGIKSSRYVKYISQESFREYSDEIGQQSKRIKRL